jgi:hypothetical protein
VHDLLMDKRYDKLRVNSILPFVNHLTIQRRLCIIMLNPDSDTEKWMKPHKDIIWHYTHLPNSSLFMQLNSYEPASKSDIDACIDRFLDKVQGCWSAPIILVLCHASTKDGEEVMVCGRPLFDIANQVIARTEQCKSWVKVVLSCTMNSGERRIYQNSLRNITFAWMFHHVQMRQYAHTIFALR